MAVYKVIQDVEAEDKLLGPLTLKGFIYALVAGFLLFINVRLAIGGTFGSFRFAIIFLLLFPMGLFGILASPLGREQPTEVWLLSHVRFFLKPKIRLWNQMAVSNLVTITAPKKIERQLTKNLSEGEVSSRLEALAMTMDSRGWAVKNAAVDSGPLSAPLGYIRGSQDTSDRLVAPEPEVDPLNDIHPSEDVLDLKNNLKAQQMDSLMQEKAVELKETRLARMDAMRRGVITPQTNSPEPLVKPHVISTRHDALYTDQQLRGVKVPPATKNRSLSQNSDGISIAAVSQLANNSRPPGGTTLAGQEVEVELH